MTTRQSLAAKEAVLNRQIAALERSRNAYKSHDRRANQAHCTRQINALKRSRAAVRAWKPRV